MHVFLSSVYFDTMVKLVLGHSNSTHYIHRYMNLELCYLLFFYSYIYFYVNVYLILDVSIFHFRILMPKCSLPPKLQALE